MRRAIFLPVFCLVLAACGRETEPPNPPDTAAQQAWFPLEIGQVSEFAVDSVVFDFGLRDSSRTFVREVVTDTFRDNTGRLAFKIERFERKDDTTAWQIRHVWSASRTAGEAIRTEDNLRFRPLVFPLDTRTGWDGHAFLDKNLEIEVAGERLRPFGNWFFEVDSVDVPGVVGNFAFDSLLVVTETDSDNLFERRFSRAKYAHNVGLVWREQWILDSQYCNQIPPPADCATKPWVEKAEKGYILRQTIIDF